MSFITDQQFHEVCKVYSRLSMEGYRTRDCLHGAVNHAIGLYIEDHSRDIQAERAKHEWQPIETAPKDGKFVLLFCPAYEGFVALASWQGGGAAAQWYGVDEDGLRYQQRAAEPTHWQPLPDPPAPNQSGGDQ